jgi:hypothetical protein
MSGHAAENDESRPAGQLSKKGNLFDNGERLSPLKV